MAAKKKGLVSKSWLGQKLKSLPVKHAFLAQGADATSAGCSLLTKKRVEIALCAAIGARYGKTVTPATDLRAPGGLGLDELAIKTDLYATVVIAVHSYGCRLRFFSPSDIASCDYVADIIDKVWADLNHP